MDLGFNLASALDLALEGDEGEREGGEEDFVWLVFDETEEVEEEDEEWELRCDLDVESS